MHTLFLPTERSCMSQITSLFSEASFSSTDPSTGKQTETTTFVLGWWRCVRFLSVAETRRTGFNLLYKISKTHAIKKPFTQTNIYVCIMFYFLKKILCQWSPLILLLLRVKLLGWCLAYISSILWLLCYLTTQGL